METKFNFKSQICTSIEQSRRLLELGLKKETADMHWYYTGNLFGWQCCCQVYIEAVQNPVRSKDATNGYILPAWSLHRLAEMLASKWGEIILFLPDTYDEIISDIEIEIGRENFNKEYLVRVEKK